MPAARKLYLPVQLFATYLSRHSLAAVAAYSQAFTRPRSAAGIPAHLGRNPLPANCTTGKAFLVAAGAPSTAVEAFLTNHSRKILSSRDAFLANLACRRRLLSSKHTAMIILFGAQKSIFHLEYFPLCTIFIL
jgi:hypothetical protein